MSKFTPGPWKVAKRSSHDTVLQLSVLDMHGMSIAWCTSREPAEVFGSDEANARLIAAAPAMFDALKEIAEKRISWAADVTEIQQLAADVVALALGQPIDKTGEMDE